MAKQTALTKQYFDKVLDRIDKRLDRTEKRLDKTNKTLDRVVTAQDHTNVILNRTTALLANQTERFREFKEDMQNVPSVLDSHTTTLDKILRNSEHWKTEAAALHSAIKRHEQWINRIAEKVGVKLEAET